MFKNLFNRLLGWVDPTHYTDKYIDKCWLCSTKTRCYLKLCVDRGYCEVHVHSCMEGSS